MTSNTFHIPNQEEFLDEVKNISFDQQNPRRDDIADSWKRCQSGGLDAHNRFLPEIDYLRIKSSQYLEHEWAFIKDLNRALIEVFSQFWQSSRAAFFFIDLDLNIVTQEGNKQLLQQLNAINFGVGANLSEELAGTNAVALASLNKRKSYVAGPEHYIKALHPFACQASPVFISDNVPIAYVAIMVDIAEFTATFHKTLNKMIDIQNHLVNLEFRNMELLLQNEMYREGINLRETGIIMTNSNGLIIHVNEWVLAYFNLEVEDAVGKNLRQTFPELTETLNPYPSPGNPQEIYFPQILGQNNKLLVTRKFVKLRDGNSGIIICLSASVPQPKAAARKAVQDAHFTFDDLIGISPTFLEAKNIAEIASGSNCNVMIIGESGSGKELFAQAIHNKSGRKDQPFISINCAAIPKDLIFSELFGYVEGAFTGAKKGGSPGKFELASKGTLFLDEISEISNEMQAVLLRVLEEGSVSRLGSSVAIPIDVRIIAATNRNICNAVASDQFRLDLYHRLCTVRIDIEPLRRRKEDIHVLANYYLQIFNRKHNKSIQNITPEAMDFMENCLWLGNVRELRNAIERGVIFCSSSYLNIRDLPKELHKHHKYTKFANEEVKKTENSSMERLFKEKLDEKNKIEALLKKHHNNKTLVAQDLGITRDKLYRRIKFLGIEPDQK